MIVSQGIMYSKENLYENPVYKTAKSRAVLGPWWGGGGPETQLTPSPTIPDKLFPEDSMKITAITKHLCFESIHV